MVRCPVCDRENDSLQCVNCGFDGSCDYERYPTLIPLKGKPDAVSRRREALRKPEPKKNTMPQEKPARIQPAPRRQAAPKEERPSRHWLEKAMRLLGWVYIALHVYYVLRVDDWDLPVVHWSLIVLALLMQLWLYWKGLRALSSNENVQIVMRIVTIPAQLFFMLGGVTLLALPFNLGVLLDLSFIWYQLGYVYHLVWFLFLWNFQDWNF